MTSEGEFRDPLDSLRRAGRSALVLVPDPEIDPSAVAVLSGSFDPMTVAHAALVEAASDVADLVLLLYSVRTLPKERQTPPGLLGERERLEVIDRFCRRQPRSVLALCSHGLLADHVAATRERFPHARIRLVMGSDKVVQLLDPKWYEDRDRALTELFSDAEVLYAERAGEQGVVDAVLSMAENRRWRGRFARLEVSPDVASVSSSAVRALIAAGRDVGHLVVPEARPFLPKRT